MREKPPIIGKDRLGKRHELCAHSGLALARIVADFQGRPR
jgi:hypothetical protein